MSRKRVRPIIPVLWSIKVGWRFAYSTYGITESGNYVL